VRPANILYLARTWGVGGAQTLIGLMLRNLPRDEFKIIVVPYDAPEKAETEFLAFLRKHSIEYVSDRIPWSGLTSWSSARKRVRELVARYDIDLIHTHDNLSNAIVAMDRRNLPCAVVASAYGWFEPKKGTRVQPGEGWFERGWRRKILFYYWVDLNLSLPRCDFVYTVSQDMKRKLLRGRTVEEKIRVVYTGLEPKDLDTPLSRDLAREKLALPVDGFVVGVVGRLSGEKGHLVLVDAVHRLAERVPHLHALFIGDGYMRSLIEARARKLRVEHRVHLAGYVDDLAAAYKAMDVCVLPSILEEGLPTSLLEAQLAGLPIVASDIGGTRETIAVGRTGVLVQPNDPESLAHAIAQLSSDPERLAAMAAAARPWVEQSFPLDRMIGQIRQIYLDAMHDRVPAIARKDRIA
jgi:glycosyltransferase involved in cell wall biosynthesis